MPESLLAIDPGKASMGWAKFIDGDLHSYGTHRFGGPKLSDAELFLAFWNWLNSHVYAGGIVAWEVSKPRQIRWARQYFGMWAILELYIASNKGKIIEVHYSTAKANLVSGRAKKNKIKAAVLELYPDLPKNVKVDVTDAISIALVALQNLEG